MGMAGPEAVEAVVVRIPGYVKAFESVFGPYSVTFDNIARAIAAYERTLVTPDSPYDRHLAGEATALTTEASRGLALFQSVGCMACHSGPSLAGPTPVGVPFRQKFPAFPDEELVARYDLTVDQGYFETTGLEEDRLMFQVPTLRNVAITAPYFSQGSVPTRPEAVQVMAKTQLNRTLEPAELADLVVFMQALTGEFPAQTLPRLPESVGESVIVDPGRTGPL
jgi:cytochrome c peroxidase